MTNYHPGMYKKGKGCTGSLGLWLTVVLFIVVLPVLAGLTK